MPVFVFRRGDVRGILIGIALIALISMGIIWQQQQFRAVPGTDLVCLNGTVKNGGPLCVRTLPARTAP